MTPEDFGSVNNTEKAACLITLGFPLLSNTAGFQRVIGEGIAAPGGAVTWYFANKSRDGRYHIKQVLERWDDFEWLQDPNNDDPLAYIITAFQNRRRLIDEIKKKEVMVLVRQGRRYALFNKHATRATMERVERFMSR